MRTFIAVDVPEDLRADLAKLQDKLKEVPTLKAKFVEKDNFHLTLKFFGEIPDAQVDQIKEKLHSIKFGKFKANFGKLGVFPSPSYVRVIWISLEPEDKFNELNKLINEQINIGDKKFSSHVTLARVSMIQDKEALQKRLQETKIIGKSFEVSSFKLKKSTLTMKGPIYEDVAMFSL